MRRRGFLKAAGLSIAGAAAAIAARTLPAADGIAELKPARGPVDVDDLIDGRVPKPDLSGCKLADHPNVKAEAVKFSKKLQRERYEWSSQGGGYYVGCDVSWNGDHSVGYNCQTQQQAPMSWKNYTSTYSNTSRDELIRQMREVQAKTKYVPPVTDAYQEFIKKHQETAWKDTLDRMEDAVWGHDKSKPYAVNYWIKPT